MIIFKFGGSSVASLNGVLKIKEILSQFNERKIVVISAMGKDDNNQKLTDTLSTLYNFKKSKKDEILLISKIVERIENYQNLLIKNTVKPINLIKLRHILINNCNYDKILSLGEYCTAKILATFLNYKFIDATKIIKENGNSFYIEQQLIFEDEENIIVPGFYYLKNNDLKVFPRGGGDITGSILTSKLNAKRYYNCTDVNGVLVYNDIKSPVIRNISSSQLLYCGVNEINVFSPYAISYLKNNFSELYICNTFDFNGDKTHVNLHNDSPFIFFKRRYYIEFYKTENISKSCFLKGIINVFMFYINTSSCIFYNKNKLIISTSELPLKDNFKKTELLCLTLFFYPSKSILRALKNYSERNNISIKIIKKHYFLKRTIIYFYGLLPDDIETKVTNLLNKII